MCGPLAVWYLQEMTESFTPITSFPVGGSPEKTASQLQKQLEEAGVVEYIVAEDEPVEDVIYHVVKRAEDLVLFRGKDDSDVRLVDPDTPWADALKGFLSPKLVEELRYRATEHPLMFMVGGAARELEIYLSAILCAPEHAEWEGRVSAREWSKVTTPDHGVDITFRAIKVNYSGGGQPTLGDLRAVRFAIEQEENRLQADHPCRFFYHGCKIISVASLIAKIRTSAFRDLLPFGPGLYTSDYAFATKWAAYASGGICIPAVVGFAVPIPHEGVPAAVAAGAGVEDAGEAWRRLDTPEHHKEFPNEPDGEWAACVGGHRRGSGRVYEQYERYGLMSGPILKNHVDVLNEEGTAPEAEEYPRGRIPMQYVFRAPEQYRGQPFRENGIHVLRQPATVKFVVMLGDAIPPDPRRGPGRGRGRGGAAGGGGAASAPAPATPERRVTQKRSRSSGGKGRDTKRGRRGGSGK